jgi:ABC-type Co2+ transport system permease subunit
MIWGLVFVVAWLIKHLCHGKGESKKHLIDAFWAALISVVAFGIVFCFHLFNLSPIRIYREQQWSVTQSR